MLRSRRVRLIALIVAIALGLVGLFYYTNSTPDERHTAESSQSVEVSSFDECGNIAGHQDEVPAGLTKDFNDCLTRKEFAERKAEQREAEQAREEIARKRQQAIADRLRPLIEAEPTAEGKLSVIVTDYCQTNSAYSPGATESNYQSEGHEQLYDEYWRAIPGGSWDVDMYYAVGTSCRDRVPSQYRPEEPLSADDFCPGSRNRLRHPTWGCGAAG